MRRKAKELQQARRDAERSGKKAPGFGGFGSSGVSGGSSSIISDALVEPEKPKVVPAPIRYKLQVALCCSACLLNLVFYSFFNFIYSYAVHWV